MLRVTAGDGQDAVDALMADGDDGRGANLFALFFAEQKVQLMFTQAATDAFVFQQQAADGHLCLGVGDPAAHRHGVVAQQDEADEGHLEILTQAVFHADHHVFQAGGIHQRENQAAGLVEEAIVVAGHVHQVRQTVTQFDVAVAQDGHLPLHQRNGVAAPVGNAHCRQ
ncbi:hypothetical protein D3C87_1525670 [compost metagenome]